MRPIKLIIKTKSETYPIMIGTKLIQKFSKILSKNSINFKKCLLVIDKNVPNQMIIKLIKSLKKKEIYKYSFLANEKNK